MALAARPVRYLDGEQEELDEQAWRAVQKIARRVMYVTLVLAAVLTAVAITFCGRGSG